MPQYRTVAEFEASATPTEAEQALIAACKAGEECTLADGTRPETFSESRHIRADLLRLLITGGSTNCGLPDDGVWLKGAWITGELNLRFAKACGRTVLHSCHFTDQPKLTQAHLQQLSLQGSHLPGLFAQGITVRGDVFLRNMNATETVDVNGAQIGGQLSCNGAELAGNGGRALNAQGAKIGQDLFLSNLNALGPIDVGGAKVGGQLACDRAVLDGNNGIAFYAQDVTTGESLFLTNLSVKGTVAVNGARIGGQLACNRSVFNGTGGRALNAQGATTKEDFLLNNLRTTGTIAVIGAQIGGQLDCTGAVLDGNGDTALLAQRMRVDQGFYWRKVTIIRGRVDLTAAHVGDLVDDITCWPTGGDDLDLDGFTYDRIVSTSPTDATRRLRWLENGAMFDGILSPQPYTQLANVLSGMGHERDARKVLLEREILLARDQWTKDQTRYQALRNGGPAMQGDLGWQWLRMWSSRLWSSLIRRTAGYGYAPERALYWTLGFLGLGWLVYFIAWQLGAMVPNSAIILTSADWANAMQANPNTPAHTWTTLPTAAHYETFYALPYAADVFVPLVDLGQQSAWSQTTVTWSGWATRLFTWALQIVGWVITALGAAAVTGIIKRDRG